jgi:nucleotide-binding universal stress UspA family protein
MKTKAANGTAKARNSLTTTPVFALPYGGRAVGEPAAGKLKVKTVVVPIDFSPESKKALRYASSLAAGCGAALRLVHVVEPGSFVNDLANVAVIRDDKEVAQDAAVRLQCLAQDEVEELIPVQAEVRIGKPYHEIVSIAKTLGADLIVIATHGYTGLKHALLGSTAERVVRHAPCPVLVVRDKEKEFFGYETKH